MANSNQTMEETDSMPTIKSPTSATNWWHPKPGLSWQWQLTGKFDFDIQADVYDIDLHVDKSAVDYFHAQGARVICYISVGSWEDWRPDADRFPAQVIGRDYEGWTGEKWLDIRQIDQLAPIMLARLDMCAAKGFDGVEPDNMEIYTNETGFPITYDDQLRYALWLAEEAHARGLAIGQKNAPDQTGDLVTVYDFAITEDAFAEDWAAQLLPYIRADKPVFAAEYTQDDDLFVARLLVSPKFDPLGFVQSFPGPQRHRLAGIEVSDLTWQDQGF